MMLEIVLEVSFMWVHRLTEATLPISDSWWDSRVLHIGISVKQSRSSQTKAPKEFSLHISHEIREGISHEA